MRRLNFSNYSDKSFDPPLYKPLFTPSQRKRLRFDCVNIQALLWPLTTGCSRKNVHLGEGKTYPKVTFFRGHLV